jgi:hypothetical protein
MPKMDFAALGAVGSFKDFEMGEMKFPEMKIGEASVKVPPEIQTTAPTPTIRLVEPAASVEAIADKHWPKPPAPSLPPKRVAGKAPVPPPIRPRPTFPRQ